MTFVKSGWKTMALLGVAVGLLVGGGVGFADQGIQSIDRGSADSVGLFIRIPAGPDVGKLQKDKFTLFTIPQIGAKPLVRGANQVWGVGGESSAGDSIAVSEPKWGTWNTDPYWDYFDEQWPADGAGLVDADGGFRDSTGYAVSFDLIPQASKNKTGGDVTAAESLFFYTPKNAANTNWKLGTVVEGKVVGALTEGKRGFDSTYIVGDNVKLYNWIAGAQKIRVQMDSTGIAGRDGDDADSLASNKLRLTAYFAFTRPFVKFDLASRIRVRPPVPGDSVAASDSISWLKEAIANQDVKGQWYDSTRGYKADSRKVYNYQGNSRRGGSEVGNIRWFAVKSGKDTLDLTKEVKRTTGQNNYFEAGKEYGAVIWLDSVHNNGQQYGFNLSKFKVGDPENADLNKWRPTLARKIRPITAAVAGSDNAGIKGTPSVDSVGVEVFYHPLVAVTPILSLRNPKDILYSKNMRDSVYSLDSLGWRYAAKSPSNRLVNTTAAVKSSGWFTTKRNATNSGWETPVAENKYVGDSIDGQFRAGITYAKKITITGQNRAKLYAYALPGDTLDGENLAWSFLPRESDYNDENVDIILPYLNNTLATRDGVLASATKEILGDSLSFYAVYKKEVPWPELTVDTVRMDFESRDLSFKITSKDVGNVTLSVSAVSPLVVGPLISGGSADIVMGGVSGSFSGSSQGAKASNSIPVGTWDGANQVAVTLHHGLFGKDTTIYVNLVVNHTYVVPTLLSTIPIPVVGDTTYTAPFDLTWDASQSVGLDKAKFLGWTRDYEEGWENIYRSRAGGDTSKLEGRFVMDSVYVGKVRLFAKTGYKFRTRNVADGNSDSAYIRKFFARPLLDATADPYGAVNELVFQSQADDSVFVGGSYGTNKDAKAMDSILTVGLKFKIGQPRLNAQGVSITWGNDTSAVVTVNNVPSAAKLKLSVDNGTGSLANARVVGDIVNGDSVVRTPVNNAFTFSLRGLKLEQVRRNTNGAVLDSVVKITAYDPNLRIKAPITTWSSGALWVGQHPNATGGSLNKPGFVNGTARTDSVLAFRVNPRSVTTVNPAVDSTYVFNGYVRGSAPVTIGGVSRDHGTKLGTKLKFRDVRVPSGRDSTYAVIQDSVLYFSEAKDASKIRFVYRLDTDAEDTVVNGRNAGSVPIWVYGTENYGDSVRLNITINPYNINNKPLVWTSAATQAWLQGSRFTYKEGPAIDVPFDTVRVLTNDVDSVWRYLTQADAEVRYDRNTYATLVPEDSAEAWIVGKRNFTGTTAKLKYYIHRLGITRNKDVAVGGNLVKHDLITISTPVLNMAQNDKVYKYTDAVNPNKKFNASLEWNLVSNDSVAKNDFRNGGMFVVDSTYEATLTLNATRNYKFFTRTTNATNSNSEYGSTTTNAYNAFVTNDGTGPGANKPEVDIPLQGGDSTKLVITYKIKLDDSYDALSVARRELKPTLDARVFVLLQQTVTRTDSSARAQVEALIKSVTGWSTLTKYNVRAAVVSEGFTAATLTEDGEYQFKVTLNGTTDPALVYTYRVNKAPLLDAVVGKVVGTRGVQADITVSANQSVDYSYNGVFGIETPRIQNIVSGYGTSADYEVTQYAYSDGTTLGKRFVRVASGENNWQEILPDGNLGEVVSKHGVTSVGTYTVVATVEAKAGTVGYPAKGESRVINFTVNPRNLSSSGISINIPLSGNDLVYNFEAKDLDGVTVRDGSHNLERNSDWVLGDLGTNNITDVGTATVTAVGQGNYTGTLRGTFTITPMTIDFDPNAEYAFTKPYDGKDTVVLGSDGPGIKFIDANKRTLDLKFGADNDYTVTNLKYNSAAVGKDKTVSGTVVLTAGAKNFKLKSAAFSVKNQTIEKGTPTADFITTSPALSTEAPIVLLLDGKAKTVTANWKSGITNAAVTGGGTGKITVKYSTEDGKAPSIIGSYEITADVDAGASFNAATNIPLGSINIIDGLDPIIKQHPVGDTSYYSGGSVTLKVVAVSPKDTTKASNIKYQWYEIVEGSEPAALKGKTAATLVINTKVVGVYTYYVDVTYNGSEQVAKTVSSNQSRVQVYPEPVSLADAVVTVNNNYDYTGKPIIITETDMTVLLGQTGLVAGQDYEIAANGIKNNTEAGNNVATVTIKGINAYKGEARGTFTINRIPVTTEYLSIAYNTDYNGLEQPISVGPRTGYKGLGEVTASYDPDTAARLGAGEWNVVLHIADGANFLGIEDLPLTQKYVIKKASWSADLFALNLAGFVDGKKEVAWTGENQGIGEVALKGLGEKYTGTFKVVYERDGVELAAAVDSSNSPYIVKIVINGDDNFAREELTVGEIYIHEEGWVSVLEAAREIPNRIKVEEAAVAPVTLKAGEVTVGPNPVETDGSLAIFWSGSKAVNGKLAVYTSVGKKIAIVNASGTKKIGAWNTAGVSTGTYLLKGTLTTKDGEKVKVSIVVGVGR